MAIDHMVYLRSEAVHESSVALVQKDLQRYRVIHELELRLLGVDLSRLIISEFKDLFGGKKVIQVGGRR